MNSNSISRRMAGKALIAGLAAGGGAFPAPAPLTLPLDGTWRFRLDREDRGIAEAWPRDRFADSIRLPGSLQEQGFGNDVTANTRWMAGYVADIKRFPSWFNHPMYAPYREAHRLRFPYWLQPKKHYTGAAWYQRAVQIPDGWRGKHVLLSLERCHWGTQLWVDGRDCGGRRSLTTPHVYRLGLLDPGEHTLTLRIDNRMLVDVGPNAHSVSDQTQTAWNGIVGGLRLEAHDAVSIDDLQIYPSRAGASARVRLLVVNHGQTAAEGSVRICVSPEGAPMSGERSVKCLIEPAKTLELDVTCSLGREVRLWDEFQPNLYSVRADLEVRQGTVRSVAQREARFGVRDFAVEGTQFAINGRKVFLRGTLECCVFPLTGYPATDTDTWRRILGAVREYGLNHVRFHSWCPPEAAFVAADELGVYLQPEVNVWTTVNSPEQHAFLKEESHRILQSYGNHPSFVMMGLGNEKRVEPEIIHDLIAAWKQDGRRLYTGLANANDSIIPEYEYCIARNYQGKRVRYHPGFRETGPFVTREPGTAMDFRDAVALYPKPLVSHEVVQYCSYPDLEQANKYTGSLRASYLDIARDQLAAGGMLDQAKAFVRASGKWQIELFKEEMEAALRTPGFGGIQLLSLSDFPGQGAALVGVLDAFWESKGYVAPAEFRRFSAPTVALARMEKRVFTTAEQFTATLEAAHFGPRKLQAFTPEVHITDGTGRAIFSRTLERRHLQVGNGTQLGQIAMRLAEVASPARYTLHLKLGEHANQWDFWVFPADESVPDSPDIAAATRLDAGLMDRLAHGAKVLLLPAAASLAGDYPQIFTPVYWNASWTDGGESQTLGLLTDPHHPVFRDFPTKGHTEWHWHELLVSARPLILNTWPVAYRPIIQIIDTWERNHKLGVLAEVRVGRGRLMICSLDLTTALPHRPVARQFLRSLLRYMSSSEFTPAVEIPQSKLADLFRT